MEQTITPSNKFGRHVIQYPMEYSLCAGCSACEIACTLTHNSLVSPSYKRIFLKKAHSKSMVHKVLTCQHCIDHPCYDACPLQEEAMHIDENGVVYIDEENCIGCGLCAKACALTPSRINLVKYKDRFLRKARKCDLCRERAEGPACIELCPWVCIGMSDEPVPDLPAAGTAEHTMNIAKESAVSTNETAR